MSHIEAYKYREHFYISHEEKLLEFSKGKAEKLDRFL
jgi:hypothetical protein